ncbi:MAG: hypothetical protein Q9162_000115 [Coniocarpon cinnabarinum]
MEPQQITAITRFFLDPTEPLPDANNVNVSPCKEEWAPHLKALLSAPGHVATWMCRLDEKPGEVLLITDWYPDSCYLAYAASEAGQALQAHLASISLAPPTTETMPLTHGSFIDSTPTAPIELTKVFFIPSELENTALQRHLLNTRGLAHWHGSRHAHLEPRLDGAAYAQLPNKGIPTETEKWHGVDVACMVWLNYWRSPEMENRFKREGREIIEERRCGRIVREVKNVYDVWKDRMVELGALGWRSEHFVPLRVHRSWFRWEREELDDETE